MYIAGIHVSDERLVEVIVTSSLFVYSTAAFRRQVRASKFANEKGGKIKSTPRTLVGKLILPMHGLPIMLPPLVYLVAVPLNGGVQPSFIARWALPDFGLGANTVNLLRVVGCLSFIGIWKFYKYTIDLLGQSFHGIGVRENPKLVSTGPYGIVRHPLYSVALIQEVILALISWNYIPIYALAICVFAFAVKLPIEEGLMESDAQIGPQYAEYKTKVPYRLVPGLW